MIILDKPYISEELKGFLDASQMPVLKTDLSIIENANHNFNLVNERDFIDMYKEGTRLYTLSENSLAWIKENINDESLLHNIDVMKDKYLFRKSISSIYPDFYFKQVSITELDNLEIEENMFPLILKPSIGFFSAGVYVLQNVNDLHKAIEDLKLTYGQWKERFPASVISESEFILEEYITGDEYAVDAYFDENGQAVILDIMKHSFTSIDDVSDTLYFTSKEIIESQLEKLEKFLNKLNNVLNIKNFPFHLELRISSQGKIVPIEFNALRFGGWSTTDISRFAYGFFTYDYYLNNKRPDWKSILKGKEDKKYTFIILHKSEKHKEGDKFDYEALEKDFVNILCLRKLDYNQAGNPYAFIFTETPYENQGELDRIANSDLSEYLR